MDVLKKNNGLQAFQETGLPRREMIPLVRCAIEYMSAYDRQALGCGGARLAEVAHDLLVHGKTLLCHSSFAKKLLATGWEMVMNGVVHYQQSPPTPLTQDLVHIPSLKDRAKVGWAEKFQQEFITDKSGQTVRTVAGRLQALEDRLAQDGFEMLSADDYTSLVQLSEAILKYQAEALQAKSNSIKEEKAASVATRNVRELSLQLKEVLQGNLAGVQSSVLSSIVAYRIAVLSQGGLLEVSSKLESQLRSELVMGWGSILGLDASKIIAQARSFIDSSEAPSLRRAMLEMLPASIADVVVSISRSMDRQFLMKWMERHQEALEARYVALVERSLFARSGIPERLSPVVRCGKIGAEHARALDMHKLSVEWNPSQYLFIHHPPYSPSRTLEAVVLTGASKIRMVGELQEHSAKMDPETERLLQLAMIVSKYDPMIGRLSSLPSILGMGEQLLKLELDETSLACEGVAGECEPPREIARLVRETGGAVAWVVNSAGELATAIVFDPLREPSKSEWGFKRISEVGYFATPLKQVKLDVPRSEALPAMPGEKEVSQGIVKVAAPVLTPTHVLSQKAQQHLTAWLEIADKSGLFKDDPTFSGSIDATALLGSLRQAAKGQALNSKAFRSIRKLSESFEDPRRRPVLRAPQLHSVRDELAQILKPEFSPGASS